MDSKLCGKRANLAQISTVCGSRKDSEIKFHVPVQKTLIYCGTWTTEWCSYNESHAELKAIHHGLSVVVGVRV